MKNKQLKTNQSKIDRIQEKLQLQKLSLEQLDVVTGGRVSKIDSFSWKQK